MFVVGSWGYFFSSGRPDVAWAVATTLVFYGVVDTLARRYEAGRERAGPWVLTTVRLQESVRLPQDVGTVWNLLHPAENAPLLSGRARSGYRVPGTPDGVGEQQAIVGLDGTTTVIEVVDVVPEERVTVRVVSPGADPGHLSTTLLAPAPGGGTILTMISEFAGPGHALRPEDELVWRAGTRDDLDRIRRTLDDA